MLMPSAIVAIEENRMWELVGTPLRCKPIRLKWVYKVKRGDIAKHKAQLIKGFVQRGASTSRKSLH